MIKETITPLRVLMAGESYWKCRLSNGKWLSELDEKTVRVNDQLVRTRRLEWLEDIIGSGDIRRVKEITLHTPMGTAHTRVGEDHMGFQFCQGTSALLTGQKIKNIQVIGSVLDKETGECTSALWDYQAQRLFVDTLWDQEKKREYQGYNSVRNWKAWRDGVIPIGALNIAAMDVRI